MQTSESANLSLLNTQPTLAQLESTPSHQDGVPADLERHLRVSGAQLINYASILLKLPQVAASTAQVLFQRFFFCASFKSFSVLKIASASLFLSTKLEECPRRNRDIINVFHYLIELHSGRAPKQLEYDGQRYTELRNSMIEGEMQVLAKLGFNVHVQHPHAFLINYLQALGLASNQELKQKAWNYLNDCGQTLATVLFQPPTIAAAAMSLAASDFNIELPTSPHWSDVFDTSMADVDMIIGLLKTLYSETLPEHLPVEQPLTL
eukprot:jgi/Hompol1/782/HPOL_005412-RA